MELEKQIFGKQMFSMPCTDSGTQRGLWPPYPAEFPISRLLCVLCRYFWWWSSSRTKLFYLNSFRQYWGIALKLFLSLFFFNYQPKITLMPKRHILGWQFLLPYNLLWPFTWDKFWIVVLLNTGWLKSLKSNNYSI